MLLLAYPTDTVRVFESAQNRPLFRDLIPKLYTSAFQFFRCTTSVVNRVRALQVVDDIRVRLHLQHLTVTVADWDIATISQTLVYR